MSVDLQDCRIPQETLSYAEEFPQLSNGIFHPNTVEAVIKVLPEVLFHKIRDSEEYIDNLYSSSESMGKKCIIKIKEIMEVEQKKAITDVDQGPLFVRGRVQKSECPKWGFPKNPDHFFIGT